MYRTFAHLLLSAILIFQGVGAVCADGAIKADMAKQAMADPCPGCPACPEDSTSGSDCLKSCSLLAGLPGMPVLVQHVPPSDALVSVSRVSLVDFSQVPPTPPPIA